MRRGGGVPGRAEDVVAGRVRRIGRLALIGVGVSLVLVACADTTRPLWVDEVRIDEDSVHLVPGGTVRLQGRAFDQTGDPMEDLWIPRIAWRAVDTTIVGIETDDTGATVTARSPGATVVRAQLGRGNQAVPIYVAPPGLDSIAIAPGEIRVGRNDFFTVEARLFDAEGAPLSTQGHRISWRIRDTGIATNPFPGGSGFPVMRFRSGGEPGRTEAVMVVNTMSVEAPIVVTLEPTRPAAPVVEGESERALRVSWNWIRSADSGYRLGRAPQAQGPWELIARPGFGLLLGARDTTYVDDDLEPGSTWWYRVEACDGALCSPPSDASSGTLPPGGN